MFKKETKGCSFCLNSESANNFFYIKTVHCAIPLHGFFNFRRTKLSFSPLSFTYEDSKKKLAKAKMLVGSMWRKLVHKIYSRLTHRGRWNGDGKIFRMIGFVAVAYLLFTNKHCWVFCLSTFSRPIFHKRNNFGRHQWAFFADKLLRPKKRKIA